MLLLQLSACFAQQSFVVAVKDSQFVLLTDQSVLQGADFPLQLLNHLILPSQFLLAVFFLRLAVVLQYLAGMLMFLLEGLQLLRARVRQLLPAVLGCLKSTAFYLAGAQLLLQAQLDLAQLL
ncbi:hypothetical protein D9M69_580480 [compost metagenome]